LSESDARRAQGAPRALACSLSGRAHLSRFEICSQITSCEIILSRVGAASWVGGRPAENVEGPLGLPGRPFRHVACTYTSGGWRTSADTHISDEAVTKRPAPRQHGRGAHGRRGGFALEIMWT
jgi:hypothetical protein